MQVVVPLLPTDLGPEEAIAVQRQLLDRFVEDRQISDFVAWYYTPMALLFSGHLEPKVTVFDCMDELSAFRGAPPRLLELEKQLFSRADIVFTGGRSLYEAKRHRHGNVQLFASSIDREHFGAARKGAPDPDDQATIPHPRIGFFGVLDERLDRELLQAIAARHPEWHFVLLGPVAKIRMEDLPTGDNLHYLGAKNYGELPKYLANWDVAILPFARNESTRFISPTKTPEYLAAGKPVVSVPIADVVHPYGDLGLVAIAENAAEFGAAIEAALTGPPLGWLEKVDDFLALNSWDQTFQAMLEQIKQVHTRNITKQAEEGTTANV